MPSIVRFGLAASDPDASASVYQAVFGRKITKWEGPQECWLVETGDEGEQGINGGLFAPNEIFSGTVNTIDVPDINAFIEKIEQHGGEIVVKKHAVPGIGFNAYAKDVDGSLFDIHQEDTQAR